MLIPGICCLAVNVVPKGEENFIYVIALAMIGKHWVFVIKPYLPLLAPQRLSFLLIQIMKCFLLLQKLLTFTAKCIIGANNAIIPTFTAMQYPTVVRNFGVGMGNLAAGVALILVPYMWLLVRISKKHTHTIISIQIQNFIWMFVIILHFLPQTYFYCLRCFFFLVPSRNT